MKPAELECFHFTLKLSHNLQYKCGTNQEKAHILIMNVYIKKRLVTNVFMLAWRLILQIQIKQLIFKPLPVLLLLLLLAHMIWGGLELDFRSMAMVLVRLWFFYDSLIHTRADRKEGCETGVYTYSSQTQHTNQNQCNNSLFILKFG